MTYRAIHQVRRIALVLTMVVAIVSASAAQVSSSALQAPSRTRASLHDSLTTSYIVSGLRVVHRLTPANDVVAANI